MHSIFIQIASYRDPELLLTLKDCISKAKYPLRLNFGICWQHSSLDSWDNLSDYIQDSRFKIIDVDSKDSRGVGWARNKLQHLYRGETYTLQLDSHHRFIKHWDEFLITEYKRLKSNGVSKPLITGYLPSYDAETEKKLDEVWTTEFDYFLPEGPIYISPQQAVPNYKDLKSPFPARFYSAHFAFTTGEFVYEVPHDPDIYFTGEEFTISVRAYTHGYDLYHIHRPIIHHEYGRNSKPKHWEDVTTGFIGQNSYKKCRGLVGQDSRQGLDYYLWDLGRVRSLKDYEDYIGVDITNRGVLDYTRRRLPLPIPKEERGNFKTYFKYCLNVPKVRIPRLDYDFWCIAFKDKHNNELFRADADSSEINTFYEHNPSDSHFRIWREYECNQYPAKFVVWPHKRTPDYNQGWDTEIFESDINYD